MMHEKQVLVGIRFKLHSRVKHIWKAPENKSIKSKAMQSIKLQPLWTFEADTTVNTHA